MRTLVIGGQHESGLRGKNPVAEGVPASHGRGHAVDSASELVFGTGRRRAEGKEGGEEQQRQ